MYDELIKRLKETSIWFGELDNVSDLLLEATNTIEELDAKYNKALQDLVKLAKNSPKVGNEFGEWIPVTERLPERKLSVLAHVCWPEYGDSAICYGCWDGRNWKLYNYEEGYLIKDFAVTNWMPLPEPPKEE